MAKNFADNLRPNILFIMADDHSANAVSAYGSILSKVFQTPNIDRLYQEGSKLENFFATNAICTPARASIMTGQYGHINGVRGLNDVFNQVDNVNLAREFQSAGYETALFGKWHLHCTPKYFDQYKILASDGGQGRYINPEFYEGNTDSQPKQIEHAGYVTDIVTDMTLDYLRNRAKKREQAPEKPFFLMCHHKAPHDFWEFADRHKALFDEVDIPVPKSLFEDRSHRSEATRDYGSSVTPRSTVRNLFEDFSAPDYVTGSLQVPEHATFQEKGLATYQKYLKDYLRTVAAIDESVGALYEELERQQILDNTIIIYTSDQGMFLGEHDYQDKRWSFEESLRSPFLVRYPKEIPIGVANSNLMANIDIAPTLMDYAGITVPFTVQGTS